MCVRYQESACTDQPLLSIYRGYEWNEACLAYYSLLMSRLWLLWLRRRHIIGSIKASRAHRGRYHIHTLTVATIRQIEQSALGFHIGEPGHCGKRLDVVVAVFLHGRHVVDNQARVILRHEIILQIAAHEF